LADNLQADDDNIKKKESKKIKWTDPPSTSHKLLEKTYFVVIYLHKEQPAI
jgi:hypothetical protein